MVAGAGGKFGAAGTGANFAGAIDDKEATKEDRSGDVLIDGSGDGGKDGAEWGGEERDGKTEATREDFVGGGFAAGPVEKKKDGIDIFFGRKEKIKIFEGKEGYGNREVEIVKTAKQDKHSDRGGKEESEEFAGIFEGLFIIEAAFADVDLGHGFDSAEDIPLCVGDESYKSDGGGIF